MEETTKKTTKKTAKTKAVTDDVDVSSVKDIIKFISVSLNDQEKENLSNAVAKSAKTTKEIQYATIIQSLLKS